MDSAQNVGVPDLGGVPAGTRLGAYEILAELGRGGLGEVYRVRNSKLDLDVALPAQLADTSTWLGGRVGRSYDVSADGRHFLAIIPVTSSGAERTTMTVITNWFDAERARVGSWRVTPRPGSGWLGVT